MAETDVTSNRGGARGNASGSAAAGTPAAAETPASGTPEAAETPADTGTSSGVTRELKGVSAGTADVSQLEDERSRLEAENAALRQQLQRPKRRQSIWRSIGVWVLLVLAWLVAPISVATIWVHNVVFDESTYMQTVAPLSSNPQVQSTVANYITFQITSHIDVESLARDVLPPRADFLAPSIANGVNNFISGAVNKFVQGERFNNLWQTVNRAAHASVVKFLSNQPGAVELNNDKLVLNLQPILQGVENNLSSSGLGGLISQLPLDKINAQFTIADAAGLAKVRDQINAMNTVFIILPFFALACLIGAVALAKDHRRTLTIGAFGVAASMLVLAIGLTLARGAYLDAVTGPHLPRDTAAVIFDTIVALLRDSLRVVFAVALVVGIGGFLWGPSRAAVWVRRSVSRGATWVRTAGERRGWTTGPVGTWVGHYKTALRVSAVALGGLIFILWNQPTGITVLVIAIIVAVLLVLIELIGRTPTAPATSG